MRRFALFFTSFLVLWSQSVQVEGIKDNLSLVYAYTNAQIYQSAGSIISNGTLLVRDGKILDIGEKVTIPPFAKMIDLEGKIIYPGFIDVFSSYGLEIEKPKEHSRAATNAWNGAIHSEKEWITAFNPNTKQSKPYISNGFTVVQSAHQDGVFRGRGFITTLNDALSNETVLKANGHQFLSLSKGTSPQNYPRSLMGHIALMRQTFHDATWYKQAHDAFHENPSQKKPEQNLALEKLSTETEFIMDPNSYLSLFRAKQIEKEFNLKFHYIGSASMFQQIDEFKTFNSTFIMPVNLPKVPDVSSSDDQELVTLRELRFWETAPYNLAELEKNNIKFVLTLEKLEKKETFWKNLRTFVEHGLSEKMALEALTTIPAKMLRLDTQIGSLKKHMLANFVVTDKNIFKNDASILSVFIQGKEFKQKEVTKDLRGTYVFLSQDDTLTLKLEGKPEKLSGTVSIGKKSTTLKMLTLQSDKLSFQAELDTLEFTGVTRFSAYRFQQTLKGFGIKENGDRFSWDAHFQTAFEAKNKEVATPQKNRISARTYPNMAFVSGSEKKQALLLIKNVTVWTSENEGILTNTDVLIEEGRFKRIGKSLSAPSNAQVIDGTGKHLTAGIIDEHSHIAVSHSVNEGTHAVTPEVRIGDVINPEDISIYRQLAGGVTASQILHGSANPIGGQAQVIKLRWGKTAEEMKFKAAPPSIKFALGENVKQSNWGDKFTTRYPQTRMGVETIMRDRFKAALAYKHEWETYNNLSSWKRKSVVPPRNDIQLETLLEVLEGKRFVHCHSYVQSEILMLMRLAEEFGFKISTFTHILEGYKVADEMRNHGAMASTFSDWWAYKFEVYDAIPYNAGLMTQKGVVTSINSDDAEMGRRLNQEAAKSVMYTGMSQEDAWKMVTINPAKQLKVDHVTGSIKTGKDADFVIWTANPLSVYASVDQTWIDGKKYFDKSDDADMRLRLKSEKNKLIQKALGAAKYSETKKPATTEQHLWHCEDMHIIN